MLHRTVRMTLAPEHVEDFLEMFGETSPSIRAFTGCNHLELWRDHRFPNILSTYSVWEDEHALEAYRKSDLFAATWSRTRKWFAAPPVAASHERIKHVD